MEMIQWKHSCYVKEYTSDNTLIIIILFLKSVTYDTKSCVVVTNITRSYLSLNFQLVP